MLWVDTPYYNFEQIGSEMTQHSRLALAFLAAFCALAAPVHAEQVICLPETSNHIVLTRGFLEWPVTYKAPFFETNIFGVVDTGQNGGRYIGHVLVDLINTRCVSAFEETYDGDSARLRPDRLGFLNIVDIITEEHGGSGNSFDHHLLLNGSQGLLPLKAPSFVHSNMGGFYIGALGGNRGDGAVVWKPLPDDGSHYSPHRYRFIFYKWNGSTFVKLKQLDTTQKFSPDPDIAASGEGFHFRDETGQELMPIAFLTTFNSPED